MAKQQTKNLGRVIVFRDYENNEGMAGQNVVEVYHVDDVYKDRISTGKFTLPIADATVLNSSEGLVYCYNVNLPYLQEASHLAEVEKNIVIGQAYLYQGRNISTGKPSPFQWALVAGIFLLAAFAIFAK